MELQNRQTQEEFVTLEGRASFVLVTLADGRTAKVFGDGTLKVMANSQTFYYKLPTGVDDAPQNTTTVKRGR